MGIGVQCSYSYDCWLLFYMCVWCELVDTKVHASFFLIVVVVAWCYMRKSVRRYGSGICFFLSPNVIAALPLYIALNQHTVWISGKVNIFFGVWLIMHSRATKKKRIGRQWTYIWCTQFTIYAKNSILICDICNKECVSCVIHSIE